MALLPARGDAEAIGAIVCRPCPFLPSIVRAGRNKVDASLAKRKNPHCARGVVGCPIKQRPDTNRPSPGVLQVIVGHSVGSESSCSGMIMEGGFQWLSLRKLVSKCSE